MTTTKAHSEIRIHKRRNEDKTQGTTYIAIVCQSRSPIPIIISMMMIFINNSLNQLIT